jgi:hypothetical protein
VLSHNSIAAAAAAAVTQDVNHAANTHACMAPYAAQQQLPPTTPSVDDASRHYTQLLNE